MWIGWVLDMRTRRVKAIPELELPLTKVGKMVRRRFGGDVRSSAGHVGFEMPSGHLSCGGGDADRSAVWWSRERARLEVSGEASRVLRSKDPGWGLLVGLKNPHKRGWACLRMPGQRSQISL